MSKWKCPKCGGTALTEIRKDVTVRTPIIDYDANGKPIYGDKVETTGGYIAGFECATCESLVIARDGIIAASHELLCTLLG